MLGDITVPEKMMNLLSKDSSVNLKPRHRAASSAEYTAESSGSRHIYIALRVGQAPLAIGQ